MSSDVYEEIIPSIGDQYPYPIKVLFMYKGAPTYSLPAGHTNIKVLCDTDKLPLFVANDILIGSTSMYAGLHLPGSLTPGTLGIPGESSEHAEQGPTRQAAGHGTYPRGG